MEGGPPTAGLHGCIGKHELPVRMHKGMTPEGVGQAKEHERAFLIPGRMHGLV